MLELIFYILIFFIGIYFGSFFTLAVYRIPKGENITYKHSYCPNCNHKLGLLDLVPLFSYIFLGGKCRYCKEKIRIRYFLLELLSGVVFLLYAISLKVNILDINKLILLFLGMLYFASLFIIAGIDKEKNMVQKSVLMYGEIVSILYIIYSCTLEKNNVYGYVIYLIIIALLQVMDIIALKKQLKYGYAIQLITLFINMLIFTKEPVAIITLILTILAIGIENIIIKFKKVKTKVSENKSKHPVAFIMCICNIIAVIMTNIIINYMIK